MGFDNAHAPQGRHVGRIVTCDHKHRHATDKGTPYAFPDAYALMGDFSPQSTRPYRRHNHERDHDRDHVSQEKIRERVYAIARGDYRPQPDEPKVWFASMQSLAEILSDENRALLRIIREIHPASIRALAETTGRDAGSLSRTLKTMSRYGIVRLNRDKRQLHPIVQASEFRIIAA